MEKLEKILWITLIILGVILVLPDYSGNRKKIYYTEILEETEEEKVVEITSNEIEKILESEEEHYKVVATVYNPTESQCDSSPLITADNSYIDLDLLKEKKIKWIAVSRDLLKEFNYGDEVVLECDHDPSINGVYEIRDTMNPRWKNRIDLLRHESEGLGKWENVKMKRKKKEG